MTPWEFWVPLLCSFFLSRFMEVNMNQEMKINITPAIPELSRDYYDVKWRAAYSMTLGFLRYSVIRYKERIFWVQSQEIQRWHHSLSTPSVYLKTYSMESILIQLKTRNKQMKVEAKVIMEYQKIFSTAFIQRFNLIKNQHRMQRTRKIYFNDHKWFSTQGAKNRNNFFQWSQWFLSGMRKKSVEKLSQQILITYSFLDSKKLL